MHDADPQTPGGLASLLPPFLSFLKRCIHALFWRKLIWSTCSEKKGKLTRFVNGVNPIGLVMFGWSLLPLRIGCLNPARFFPCHLCASMDFAGVMEYCVRLGLLSFYFVIPLLYQNSPNSNMGQSEITKKKSPNRSIKDPLKKGTLNTKCTCWFRTRCCYYGVPWKYSFFVILPSVAIKVALEEAR